MHDRHDVYYDFILMKLAARHMVCGQPSIAYIGKNASKTISDVYTPVMCAYMRELTVTQPMLTIALRDENTFLYQSTQAYIYRVMYILSQIYHIMKHIIVDATDDAIYNYIRSHVGLFLNTTNLVRSKFRSPIPGAFMQSLKNIFKSSECAPYDTWILMDSFDARIQDIVGILVETYLYNLETLTPVSSVSNHSNPIEVIVESVTSCADRMSIASLDSITLDYIFNIILCPGFTTVGNVTDGYAPPLDVPPPDRKVARTLEDITKVSDTMLYTINYTSLLSHVFGYGMNFTDASAMDLYWVANKKKDLKQELHNLKVATINRLFAYLGSRGGSITDCRYSSEVGHGILECSEYSGILRERVARLMEEDDLKLDLVISRYLSYAMSATVLARTSIFNAMGVKFDAREVRDKVALNDILTVNNKLTNVYLDTFKINRKTSSVYNGIVPFINTIFGRCVKAPLIYGKLNAAKSVTDAFNELTFFNMVSSPMTVFRGNDLLMRAIHIVDSNIARSGTLKDKSDYQKFCALVMRAYTHPKTLDQISQFKHTRGPLMVALRDAYALLLFRKIVYVTVDLETLYPKVTYLGDPDSPNVHIVLEFYAQNVDTVLVHLATTVTGPDGKAIPAQTILSNGSVINLTPALISLDACGRVIEYAKETIDVINVPVISYANDVVSQP